MLNLRIVILALCILTALQASAQLSFPGGTVLHLNTTSDYVYNETGIYFYTGKNKVTDYTWTKDILDSLDPRWDFQACMNGDCKIGLPTQGPFITDFGINDTTGYIKFHVSMGKFSGASWLSYTVAHKKDTADKARLIFNIRYTKANALKDESADRVYEVYPQPADAFVIVKPEWLVNGTVLVYSAEGKCMVLPADGNKLDVSKLNNGMYLMVLPYQGGFTHQKMLVLH